MAGDCTFRPRLDKGTYKKDVKKACDAFRKEYDERVLSGLSPRGREATLVSLGAFERIVAPRSVDGISAAKIDEFVARRKEPGKKKAERISPATVNKDLRHLKVALNTAVEWDLLEKVPRIRMERLQRKLVR